MTREQAIQVLNMIEAHGSLAIQAKDMAIKALEQEQYYKDLAESYEKTINKLTKAISEKEPKFIVHVDGKLEQINDAVAKWEPRLESITRWIPVSERLPEDGQIVLGTNSYGDLYETYAWDDCGEIKWCANGCFDVPIVAWMPLPAPYTPESEG